MINALANRMKLMVARCVVKLVNDAAKMQELQVQVLSDEVKGRAEHFQHYGFSSRAFAGAEGIVLFPNGNRSHPLVFCVDDRRYRKKEMEEGEVALYTDEGDYIYFKRGKIIEIRAGEKVKVDAPEVEMTGNLHVLGSITCDNDVSDANGSMQEMRDFYNEHVHGASDPPTPEMT
jgi:phage baseplate assembly protein V